MNKKRIFSGIQPSGQLHIGNYLGAIKNWVDLQDSYESIFCIVDLHAITVAQKPEELRKRTLEIAKIYLASGIDPKKSAMFVQSHISEHSEMTWILNTITRMSDLFKMTQFKDKAQKEGQENSGVGLFDYPVLMAADILLYDTEVVPVGEDQVQHIELARTLARRFNKKFGQTFVVPEASVKKETMRIMGLDDPTKKMSKSASSEYNYIGLLDEPELIAKKIKKAVTGSGSEVKYSDDEPALKNLINIYSAFSGKSVSEIVSEYKGKGYADFKEGLTKAVLDFIIPFQERFNAIDDKKVLDILQKGAEKVRPLAEKKIKEVKEKIGFVA
jgi:tryptophanyl-tRNA synthetase